MKKILLPAVGCSAFACALSSPKIRFLMRASVIIWLSMAISLHLSAFDTNGQGIDTEITLELKNTTLKEALRVLQSKTDMPMVYAPDLVEGYDNISLSHAKRTVRAILEIILQETDLTYLERDNAIVLRRKAIADSGEIKHVQTSILTASFIVTGKVTDASTDEALAGVNVLVKGTTRGTTSDATGVYSISVNENEVLQFSFIGFKSFETTVANQITINVLLYPDATSLKEVQIISTNYFSTTKEKSTMNISKVNGDEIKNQPVTTLMNAIIGRMPGVDVTPVNGAPGAASRIQIRGNNSVNSFGSYPLYVIDGVQIDSRPLESNGYSYSQGIDPLSSISPSNIESIEVLKDGAATAIYGSRGANGVIRITTKRAGSTQNATTFDFNVYSGIGTVANRMDLLSAKEYLSMRREAYKNDDLIPDQYVVDMSGVWDTTRSTDWQSELLGGTAKITDIQGVFSGGNEETTFRVGGGYHKETTIYPGKFGFERGNGEISFNHESRDQKLRISAGGIFGWTKNRGYDNANYVNLALTLPPVAPTIYSSDGTLNWQIHEYSPSEIVETWQNPLANLLNTVDGTSYNIISNATVGYEIRPGLIVKAIASFSSVDSEEIVKNSNESYPPSIQIGNSGTATFSGNNRKSLMVEPQITFNRSYGRNNISAIAGTTWQDNRYSFISFLGTGYPSDDFLGSLSGARVVTNQADNSGQYKYASVYAHVGYDYNGKYIIDLTGRRDGSSRFGPGRRYGNFGAVSAGWVFSEENIIRENLRFISFGKIRSSYGLTGNDQIGDYQYLDTYSPVINGYQNGVSVVPTALYNPDYAWEVTKKLEVGLEMGFINNRIAIEASWYRNLSTNQLVNAPLSATAGFPSVLENFDAVVENTGVEIILSTKNFSGDSFRWNTTFNLSIPQNKLLKFDGLSGSVYAQRYQVGKPLSIQRLYTFKGINPETGLYEVKDINGDGAFNTQDRTFMNPTGRTLYGGMLNTFTFKGFDLSFLFQFSRGKTNGILSPNAPGTLSNQPVSVIKRWRQTGDEKELYQKYISVDNSQYSLVLNSDYNYGDGSFARLKTVSLGYRFSRDMISKIKLDQARIFLEANNLLTITKYKGLDPETKDSLPPLRMITLGIQLKL